LYKIIFDGIFPSYTIVVKSASFQFIFTDEKIPVDNVEEQLTFFENVVNCWKCEGKEFVRTLPACFFYLIVNAYYDFQLSLGKILFDSVDDFTKLVESRSMWEIYKRDPGRVMTVSTLKKLNSFQKKWIIVNTQRDREDKSELISDIFDALKPWLDKELYSKIEEGKNQGSRENFFYNDENIDEVDKNIRKKAREVVQKSKQSSCCSSKDDLDIVKFERK